HPAERVRIVFYRGGRVEYFGPVVHLASSVGDNVKGEAQVRGLVQSPFAQIPRSPIAADWILPFSHILQELLSVCLGVDSRSSFLSGEACDFFVQVILNVVFEIDEGCDRGDVSELASIVDARICNVRYEKAAKVHERSIALVEG